MKDDRKKWIRPQLIVLGRGTPEENVLAGLQDLEADGCHGDEGQLQEGNIYDVRPFHQLQHYFQDVLGSFSSP
jgi:hypothetical protein